MFGQHQMIVGKIFNYKKDRTQVTSGGIGGHDGFALRQL